MAPYVVCTVTLELDHTTPWDVTFRKRFASRGVQGRGLPPLASAVWVACGWWSDAIRQWSVGSGEVLIEAPVGDAPKRGHAER